MDKHPYYGPCDAFGPDKTCSECKKIDIFTAANEEWIRWLRTKDNG